MKNNFYLPNAIQICEITKLSRMKVYRLTPPTYSIKQQRHAKEQQHQQDEPTGRMWKQLKFHLQLNKPRKSK